MKSRDLSDSHASAYSPKEYWANLAENFHSADAAGFAPVLHPAAPPWFNRLIDGLQFRAVRRALGLANILPGARILDVGCGTGRWIRRYQELGFLATGVDATPAMLHLARELGTAPPLIAGEAHRLPFRDGAFDSVSDITVIQHIPVSLQPQAVAEMMRVIRPGGSLILMELIRGEGEHIFPRNPQDWIEQAALCGAKLLGWFGQEYLLLDRLFVRAAQTAAGRNGIPASVSAVSRGASSQHSTMARRIYWGLRRVTAPISAWSDPVTELICPAHIASHGVFVFQK
jgi:SAM-dependent methyltransferase